MLMEIHMLKNYPATNLNRDENGMPKTCFFGGALRGRIASQCLKHTWRMSDGFKALDSYAIRSAQLPECVLAELSEDRLSEQEAKHVKNILIDIGRADKKKKASSKETPENEQESIEDEEQNKEGSKQKEKKRQTFLFTREEVRLLADIIRKYKNGEYQKKGKNGTEKTAKLSDVKPQDLNDRMKENAEKSITIDIALFGRMSTAGAFTNVEASMQVSHAVSTHPVNRENDFFTAVDDLMSQKEATGADMMGYVDYDSCCYYHYAAIDIDKLKENLGEKQNNSEQISRVIATLLHVMAETNPSGKQNTFAGHVLPELMMVEFKDKKVPLNYANAFAEPVQRFSKQISQESVNKLADEVDLMDKFYCLSVKHRAWMALRKASKPEKCESFESFNQFVESCVAWAEE